MAKTKAICSLIFAVIVNASLNLLRTSLLGMWLLGSKMLSVNDALRLGYTERKQRKSNVAPDGFLVNLAVLCKKICSVKEWYPPVGLTAPFEESSNRQCLKSVLNKFKEAM